MAHSCITFHYIYLALHSIPLHIPYKAGKPPRGAAEGEPYVCGGASRFTQRLKEQLKSNHLVSVQACIRIEMPSIQACNQYQMYTRSLHTPHHHPPNIVKRRCCKQQMRVSPMKYLRHIKNAIPASLGTCFGLRCGLTGCGAGAVQGRPLS